MVSEVWIEVLTPPFNGKQTLAKEPAGWGKDRCKGRADSPGSLDKETTQCVKDLDQSQAAVPAIAHQASAEGSPTALAAQASLGLFCRRE